MGEWDGFFGTLLSGLEDKDQTEATVRGVLLAETDKGVVPNIVAGVGITPDRSQPPIGSYCLWKVYQRFHDRNLLDWAYPRLKKWHEFWLHDRGDGQPKCDGNRDGLLKWGSDRMSTTTPAAGSHGSLQNAKSESGMDDGVMFDDAKMGPGTYTMDLDEVGLNALYTLDAECLAKIATLLGHDDDSRNFLAEYEHLKQLIREKLWNEQDGIYESRYWDGRPLDQYL